jgi:hypothetical protein
MGAGTVGVLKLEAAVSERHDSGEFKCSIRLSNQTVLQTKMRNRKIATAQHYRRGLTCVCPAIRNGSGSERQRPGKLTTCPRRLVSSRGICWASPPPLRIERFRRCSLPALQ